ncbi:hypothetical protein M9458_052124, partial [Cirrhinus mrigala]
MHAMAILQVYQAKVLKDLHKGVPDPELLQEMRSATDYALRATKVTAQALGRTISTMVVQERHLWLNLAEMTIRLGYAIHFTRRPPKFRGILYTSVRGENAVVLRAEIAVLLAKDAIETAPSAEMKKGFYSPYFIVPKKGGRLRPILDLRVLNRALLKLPFKMLTLKHILTCVRDQDWFVAIDLKDAYFHVSMLPRHRPFLRFASEGRAYQYKGLSFGLSLLARVFTKVAEAALAPLREVGIRILNYLDNWLILAHSQDLVYTHRDVVLNHLARLGLRINWEKSKLSPAQSISFLGVELDLISMSAHLSPEGAQSVLRCVKTLRRGSTVPLKQFQRLLGHMASSATVMPLGLMHMSNATALASYPSPEMGMAPRHVPCEHHTIVPQNTQHLTRHLIPMGRGAPGTRGEWRLHPQSVQLIWNWLGQTQVDLFASPESTLCQLWYRLTEAPLGIDALAHSWLRDLLKYAFPPVSLIAQILCKVREDKEQVLLVALFWPNKTWFLDLVLLASAPPWRIPLRKDLLSQGEGHNLAPVPRSLEPPSLVPGRDQEDFRDLSPSVVNTLLQARAPSTRRLYDLKWCIFVNWCSSRGKDPRRCGIESVLSYLQGGLDKHLSASTLKVHVAAISANHDLVEGRS